MCEETIKNCWVRGSESARGAAEENAVWVVVVTGLWVRVWWLNDKKLYDLLWVKWRLDKVGFDCCCCVYVYCVLYLASLLPVVTAIDCWYCFIVLASHVTFFHFFLLLLLSFLAFCSLAWSLYPWMALSVFAHLSDECGCEIDSKRHSDSIRGHHFHNPFVLRVFLNQGGHNHRSCWFGDLTFVSSVSGCLFLCCSLLLLFCVCLKKLVFFFLRLLLFCLDKEIKTSLLYYV